MHQNIELRSKVISFLKNKMLENNFLEFQTPILTASSPEGARDFLVLVEHIKENFTHYHKPLNNLNKW